MKKITILLLIATFCASFVTGCKNKQQPSEEGEQVKYTIGMSQCNLGEPWRVQMNADIANAAKAHPEIKVIFKDAQNDTLRQQSQVGEFINSEVDLLIIDKLPF